MSSKFKLVNRHTGEAWKPERGKKQYPVLYQSLHPAIVTEDIYIHIEPLDIKDWYVKFRVERR